MSDVNGWDIRRYALRRFLLFVPTLFCVTLLVFILMRLAPGDAAYMRLTEYGLDITEDNLNAVRHELGLDRPLWEQYSRWLVRAARLDFGRSGITKRAVFADFISHIGATVRLSMPALAIALLIAFPFGILSAMYTGGWLDRISRGGTLLFMSVPSFCWGLSLILLFSVKLRWLPSFGDGSLRHLILPC